MINKTVVIFGVFDGIHAGHSSFIGEAKKQGNHLVAIVARDQIVLVLKGKLPKHNEVDRIKSLLKVPEVDLVLLGDPEMSTYNILKEVKPQVIFLGYDQQDLEKNLNKMIQNKILPEIEIIKGTAFQPETFHSSLLNKN